MLNSVGRTQNSGQLNLMQGSWTCSRAHGMWEPHPKDLWFCWRSLVRLHNSNIGFGERCQCNRWEYWRQESAGVNLSFSPAVTFPSHASFEWRGCSKDFGKLHEITICGLYRISFGKGVEFASIVGQLLHHNIIFTMNSSHGPTYHTTSSTSTGSQGSRSPDFFSKILACFWTSHGSRFHCGPDPGPGGRRQLLPGWGAHAAPQGPAGAEPRGVPGSGANAEPERGRLLGPFFSAKNAFYNRYLWNMIEHVVNRGTISRSLT
jgi:hypothetical protein